MKNRMTLKEDSLYANQSYTFQVEKKENWLHQTVPRETNGKKKKEKKNLFEFPFEAKSNKGFLPFNNLSLPCMWQLRACTRTTTLKLQSPYFPLKLLLSYLGRLRVRAEEWGVLLWPSTGKEKGRAEPL